MKENVIDVLLYLFENYIDNDDAGQPDKAALETELEQVGFPEMEIDKALVWLENMTVIAEESVDAKPVAPNLTMRFYAEEELELLNTSCRGYLLFLEQVGVLDAATREIVIRTHAPHGVCNDASRRIAVVVGATQIVKLRSHVGRNP